ncbi:MAG: hypothetical protein WC909_01470 [Candidatus Paceibacterota bacterium]|jgi:hypothetical protein
MNTKYEISIEQEIDDTKMSKPHVVILGAGASRATCPSGDKNGKKLPLMIGFADIVGIKSMLQEWGIDPDQNFEEIFSYLYEKNENKKLKQIENAIEEYFNQLELPLKPTIYDHLVLSLREKDLIATFNWDPLLLNAYLRNGRTGLKLPKLAFLHGNVSVGYCEKDKIAGLANLRCKKCGEILKKVPLIYPIKEKNYTKNLFIANEWKQLKWGFQNAFMITIFGYSGPKNDTEAIMAMKKAWGDKDQRSMEQTAFITIQSENEISENWEPFIHTHHYEMNTDFYDSWIANHPRRTGEAYLNQYLQAKFINNNPIPRTLDFPALWEWYGQFKKVEDMKT